LDALRTINMLSGGTEREWLCSRRARVLRTLHSGFYEAVEVTKLRATQHSVP